MGESPDLRPKFPHFYVANPTHNLSIGAMTKYYESRSPNWTM